MSLPLAWQGRIDIPQRLRRRGIRAPLSQCFALLAGWPSLRSPASRGFTCWGRFAPIGANLGLSTFACGESRAENAVEPPAFSKRASGLLASACIRALKNQRFNCGRPRFSFFGNDLPLLISSNR